ncbi:sugar phosphate isomerase/epimerase family protein [Desulfurivibrio alkaliphilus]|uniref:Xylose isomerase domain protein TIM barrel n=1 Tax=Desulfurivibrio alkaliphilus (strain DSM 19089 / UNIQEM U267 / AHT2) TaxID=589865 RepID=D6Z2Z9_DESAT|nr:sugar phosphate isomerase/epimerase family protein [Desulfurivibrio alkaliphilus]ADH85924.1 Xylose isomerase domain protein TIM barrel [Desulfurivibrio alkaliphilus AHT 2]
MSDWSVGLSTGCFYRTSIFECLPLIREHGFSMLEICSHPDHLDYHDLALVRRAARQLEAWSLEAYSFHAPFAAGLDITSPAAAQRRRSIDEMLAAVEAAALLGARYLVLHPGPEKELQPEPGEYLQRRQNGVLALNEIAARCRLRQVQLVLENMLPHLFCGDISELLRCLGAVREGGVGTCLDTGHAVLSGELFHIATTLAGSLKMIHASDNHGHYDDHLPPGQGGIDWLPLLGHLQRMGFAGGIILELNGDAKIDPETMLREAARARLYLRRLSRQLL